MLLFKLLSKLADRLEVNKVEKLVLSALFDSGLHSACTAEVL